MTDGKPAAQALRDARDFLLATREDYAAARAGFRWPRFEHFNFALDWFDDVARRTDREALRVVAQDGSVDSRSYAELSEASDRAANMLRGLGVQRGDVILLMLDNIVPLWEAMLAAIKLGAITVPASTLLSRSDVEDRLERAHVRFVITTPKLTELFPAGDWTGLTVGGARDGWQRWEDWQAAERAFTPDGPTRAEDPMLLYFTSGTTAKPKLVLHSHVSYPVGHLSTMYWIGLQPGDVHLNISSPGWAKHAWSCVFAPWLAEATILAMGPGRFDPVHTLDLLAKQKVTSFCAPPTVWRHLIQQDLKSWTLSLREAVAAGEPLNPEIIAQVQAAWGFPVRDGFGQTECSAMIGNTPGQPISPGSVGRPLPGFELESILIEHPAVMEAAVIPSPDPIRLAVPKCLVNLAEGHAPSAALAADILAHARNVLGPFKRIRRIQFDNDLPKTISGKIRRVELRRREVELRKGDGRADLEWFEEDLAAEEEGAKS